MRFNRFLAGYRECAAWADCGPDQETEGKEWSPDLEKLMRDDCAAFLINNVDLCNLIDELAPGYSDERAGHDFWLTRNGHGAGFWDRPELEVTPEGATSSLGDLLTAAAEHFGPCDLYVGDDNQVYA